MLFLKCPPFIRPGTLARSEKHSPIIYNFIDFLSQNNILDPQVDLLKYK